MSARGGGVGHDARRRSLDNLLEEARDLRCGLDECLGLAQREAQADLRVQAAAQTIEGERVAEDAISETREGWVIV